MDIDEDDIDGKRNYNIEEKLLKNNYTGNFVQVLKGEGNYTGNFVQILRGESNFTGNFVQVLKDESKFTEDVKIKNMLYRLVSFYFNFHFWLPCR